MDSQHISTEEVKRLNTVTIGGRGIGALWGKGRGDFTPSATLVGGGGWLPNPLFSQVMSV